MVGCSALREQIDQHMQDVARPDMTVHLDSKTLPRVLIDHGQHPESPAVMAAPLYEVIGPYMVPPARPQTDARPVIQPQTAPLRLLQRYFQPLAPHALVVHVPAFRVQQRRHPTIAVPAVLARQADDRRRQCVLVITDDRLVSLRRPRLPQDAAGTPFRDQVLLPRDITWQTYCEARTWKRMSPNNLFWNFEFATKITDLILE